MNWSDITTLSKAGVNWSNLNTLSTANINWTDIQALSKAGVNWTDLGKFSSLFEEHVRALLPELIDQLRVTPFIAGEIELELVAHNDGAHFALHGDLYTGQGSARGDRLLSAVYYFHRAPKAFSGGCLRLHRIGARPGDTGVDIAPDQNSLVVFPSWAPHEVLTVHCPSGAFGDSRFAVNCWVYRERAERPKVPAMRSIVGKAA